MNIEAVMTSCPYSVSAQISLDDVIAKMALHNIRHMPVIDNGNLVGVITERDAKLSQLVCKSSGYCPTVGDVCHKDPFTVHKTEKLASVALKMAEQKTDYALIEDDQGFFVGIFTSTDACKTLHRLLSAKA